MSCIYLLTASMPVSAQGFWNGRQIMEEVQRRHQLFPYVYEEHSIVMVDQSGQRDSRQARRYTRVEEDGTVKLLYMFDAPPEVKGVTLLATRDRAGKTTTSIYLPAFGTDFIESSGVGSGGNFLGTDFSIEDLTAEQLDDYDYRRRDDEKIEDIAYFVVDVLPAGREAGERRLLKRHYIRQDSFFITRTDHYDQGGRLCKQQQQYDLKQLDDEMWGAGLILMNDKKNNHQSLIKINRRIFSLDYVPGEMFSRDWILAQYPPLAEQLPEDAAVPEATDADMPAGGTEEQAP